MVFGRAVQWNEVHRKPVAVLHMGAPTVNKSELELCFRWMAL